MKKFNQFNESVNTSIEKFDGTKLFTIENSQLVISKKSKKNKYADYNELGTWDLTYDEYKRLEELSDKTKEMNDATDEHIRLLKKRKIGYDQQLEGAIEKVLKEQK